MGSLITAGSQEEVIQFIGTSPRDPRVMARTNSDFRGRVLSHNLNPLNLDDWSPPFACSTCSNAEWDNGQLPSPLEAPPSAVSSQRAQYPLTKEYSLDHNKDPFII
ncbi:unnamed protein product [Symbiodinium natans]|uniref:Uncharacterized protein n=1 Tax=Symbiodinium natans TaxID=878477 RepID=A0A812ULY9_9DINO|nr:unnamed protein product [Symbiodinium natans]